ncbi:MAG: F0F1 ATP synthase subunit A [Balneolaceae bacterium]
MIQMLRRLFLTLLFLSASTPATFALDEQATSESPIDILGTVADHDNLQTPFGSIPLPRIFYWENGAGESQLDIYKSSASAIASGLFEDIDHVVSPVSGHIIVDLSITSHLFFFWLSLISVLLVTLYVRSLYIGGTGRISEPKGVIQNLFEVFFVFIRDEVAKPNIDDRKYARYVPYLFTVFMTIAFMNVFGLLPWSATATADITVTAALAICTFVITQFSGTKNHWGHVFWFPGVPFGVKILMIPVEIIGLFTKPFALAIRLFANMMSGKIMIIAILGLIFIFNDMFGSTAAYGISVFSVILTAVLYILKLFVSLLQAYIFTLLSAVFIGMAAESEEDDEEHYYAEHTA